jgi:hypothetical protein
MLQRSGSSERSEKREERAAPRREGFAHRGGRPASRDRSLARAAAAVFLAQDSNHCISESNSLMLSARGGRSRTCASRVKLSCRPLAKESLDDQHGLIPKCRGSNPAAPASQSLSPPWFPRKRPKTPRLRRTRRDWLSLRLPDRATKASFWSSVSDTPIARGIQASNPDFVYIASSPTETRRGHRINGIS